MKRWASDAVWLVMLVLVTGLLFAYTVEIRGRWRQDTLTPGHHQFLTSSTLKFARNWYREGAFALTGGMLENPAGVEFPTLASRAPYPSYPPGCIVPVHLLALARGAEPTPILIFDWNLANHALLALLLGLLAYVCVRRAGVSSRSAGILALVPPVAVLLLPQPLYLLQMVFFADQAVLVPFALLILAEIWRETRPPDRRFLATGLVAAIGVWGLGTDWLFAFVLVMLYLKRLLLGEAGSDRRDLLRAALCFWIPPALVLLLFVLQLGVLGVLPDLWGKFLYRSGIGTDATVHAFPFWHQFWLGHLGNNYGLTGLALLWLAYPVAAVLLGILVWRRRQGRPVPLALRALLWPVGLLLLPCLLHLWVFRQHARIHDFTALKFLLPLALVPTILLPVAAATLWLRRDARPTWPDALRRWGLRLAPVAILVAVTLQVVRLHPDHEVQFRMTDWTVRDLALLLERHGRADDIVVTPSTKLAIPAEPPRSLPLALTMRRVHHLADPAALTAFQRGIPQPHGVLILLGDEDAPPAWDAIMARSRRLGACRTWQKGYRLYRFQQSQ